MKMGNENANFADVTEDNPQIVGAFPQIIVTGTAEKPYYEIMYFEFEDGEIHVGYSSYDLAHVFRWLEEFFGETRAKIVDPESLRPKGRWVGEGDGYADGELVYDVWYCSECNHCIDDGTDDPKMLPNYCPNCGMKMVR